MLGLGNKVQEIILLYEIQHIQDISRSRISRFWIQLGLGYLDLVYLDLGYIQVQGSQIQDIFRFRIYLDLRYIQIQDIARSRIYLDLGYIQIQDISRYEISCIVKCLLKLTNLLSSLVSSFPTQTHPPPPHTLTPTLLLNYKLLQTNLSCPFVSLQIRNGENFYMYRRTFKAYPNYIDAL